MKALTSRFLQWQFFFDALTQGQEKIILMSPMPPMATASMAMIANCLTVIHDQDFRIQGIVDFDPGLKWLYRLWLRPPEMSYRGAFCVAFSSMAARTILLLL